MRDTLKNLNQVVGINGSMLVTRDGMVAASELGEGLEEEAVAALATSVIRTTTRALRKIDEEGFSLFILTASFGRLVLVDAEIAYLVVVTERTINIDATILEMQSAVRQIRKKARITLKD
jgi:predicted regulator of Ras-like GTPase activity (Roadblock/LC7/MglB family)